MPELGILAGLCGLIVGSLIVYLAPRLVAYRLDHPVDLPPHGSLIPVAGARALSQYRVRAVVLELAVSALFVAMAMRYGWTVRLALASGYASLLVLIGYIDLDYRLVLNRLSYPGAVLALGGSLFWPGLGPLSAIEGAALGLGVMGVFDLVGRGRLGTGDTKLAGLIGLMRGFPNIFYALFYGILLGGVGAVLAMVVLKRSRKDTIPYAPFLVIGAILSLFLTSP